MNDVFLNATVNGENKQVVEIVGGTTPKVWKKSETGTLADDNKKYEYIEITKLTDKDKYKKEITVKSEE